MCQEGTNKERIFYNSTCIDFLLIHSPTKGRIDIKMNYGKALVFGELGLILFWFVCLQQT